MHYKQFIMVSDTAETRLAMAQNPGWGMIASKGGHLFLYCNNPKLVEALTALGGLKLKQLHHSIGNLPKEFTLAFGPFLGAMTFADVISQLVGGDEWNFDW